jgi:hypothetical protein
MGGWFTDGDHAGLGSDHGSRYYHSVNLLIIVRLEKNNNSY